MLYVYTAKYVFTAIYMLAIITHAIDHLLPEPETSIQPTIVDPSVKNGKNGSWEDHLPKKTAAFSTPRHVKPQGHSKHSWRASDFRPSFGPCRSGKRLSIHFRSYLKCA